MAHGVGMARRLEDMPSCQDQFQSSNPQWDAVQNGDWWELGRLSWLRHGESCPREHYFSPEQSRRRKGIQGKGREWAVAREQTSVESSEAQWDSGARVGWSDRSWSCKGGQGLIQEGPEGLIQGSACTAMGAFKGFGHTMFQWDLCFSKVTLALLWTRENVSHPR